MPEARLCPECRTELPTDAPEELCPQCLLHVALSDSDHGLVGEGPGTEAYHNRFTAPSAADLAPLFPQLEILEPAGTGRDGSRLQGAADEIGSPRGPEDLASRGRA